MYIQRGLSILKAIIEKNNKQECLWADNSRGIENHYKNSKEK